MLNMKSMLHSVYTIRTNTTLCWFWGECEMRWMLHSVNTKKQILLFDLEQNVKFMLHSVNTRRTDTTLWFWAKRLQISFDIKHEIREVIIQRSSPKFNHFFTLLLSTFLYKEQESIHEESSSLSRWLSLTWNLIENIHFGLVRHAFLNCSQIENVKLMVYTKRTDTTLWFWAEFEVTVTLCLD